MTPKEKAFELVKIFQPHTDVHRIPIYHAKKCALIAVDEIIKNIINTPTDYGASWTYWQEVKQAIKSYDTSTIRTPLG